MAPKPPFVQSLVSRFEVRLDDIDTGATLVPRTPVGKSTIFAFHELVLSHKQRVRTVVTAINRAGAEFDCSTNGILIDTTPPEPLPHPAGVAWDGNSALFGYEDDDLEYTWATRSAFGAWARFEDPGTRLYTCNHLLPS